MNENHRATIDNKKLRRENEQLKKEITVDYINEGYSLDVIEEVALEEYNEYLYKNSISASENVDLLNGLFEENQRLTNKLNSIALELVDDVISMGKAVEISEMSYNEFLEYRAKHNKPMELKI